MPKVYNTGKKPLIYNRNFDGTQCIHPGKFLVFGEDESKKLIKKFDNAVSEEEWIKLKKKSEKKVK